MFSISRICNWLSLISPHIVSQDCKITQQISITLFVSAQKTASCLHNKLLRGRSWIRTNVSNDRISNKLDDSENPVAAMSGVFSKETIQIAQILESLLPIEREMVPKRLHGLAEALSLDFSHFLD